MKWMVGYGIFDPHKTYTTTAYSLRRWSTPTSSLRLWLWSNARNMWSRPLLLQSWDWEENPFFHFFCCILQRGLRVKKLSFYRQFKFDTHEYIWWNTMSSKGINVDARIHSPLWTHDPTHMGRSEITLMGWFHDTKPNHLSYAQFVVSPSSLGYVMVKYSRRRYEANQN